MGQVPRDSRRRRDRTRASRTSAESRRKTPGKPTESLRGQMVVHGNSTSDPARRMSAPPAEILKADPVVSCRVQAGGRRLMSRTSHCDAAVGEARLPLKRTRAPVRGARTRKRALATGSSGLPRCRACCSPIASVSTPFLKAWSVRVHICASAYRKSSASGKTSAVERR